MLGYLGSSKKQPAKRTRSERRDSSDEELCDESKKSKSYITPKKSGLARSGKSPEEKAATVRLASTLKEARSTAKKRHAIGMQPVIRNL